MKKIFYLVAGLIASFTLYFTAPVQTVFAGGYTVVDTSAVLYTNSETVIFADADPLSTVVLAQVDSDLPILVTGITSNGYFRISLADVTYYIPGTGLSLEESNDSLYNQVYNILIAQKAYFPEGTPLTNESFYYAWNGGYFSGGYGCAGFAFYLSDQAFGTSPAKIHRDYNNIKVGDILRINNDTHSVIVLDVHDDSVIVAEGNYNSTVHWGREIPKSKIIDASSYIMTRY
jgi:hypothetical protein